MILENLPIVDLEITDDRFEGKTFTGTVESIYNEMKGLKPEMFADEVEFDAEALSSSFEKRQAPVITKTSLFLLKQYGVIDMVLGQLWLVQQSY